MKDILLDKNERLDDLMCGGLKLIQNKTLYCFNSDSVLLSNFVKCCAGGVIVDLCAGSGVIGILLTHKTKAAKVISVEVQECMFNLLEKNVQINELDDKIEPINAPLQTVKLDKKVDVVVCNPPYSKLKEKMITENESVAICRHEILTTLSDIIEAAASMLKFHGKFYIVHKAHRLAECIALMSKYGIEPKNLLLVRPKSSKAVDSFVIEGMMGGSVGINVDTLTVYNEDGSMTDKAYPYFNDTNID